MEGEASATDSDEEVEIIAETDADRRQALQDADHSSGDLQKLCTKDWELFRDEFKSESSTSKMESSPKAAWSSAPVDDDIIEIFSSSDEGWDTRARCDVPQPSGSVFTTGNAHPSRKGKGKETVFSPSTSRPQESLRRGKLVQTEIDLRNKPPGSGTTVSIHHIDKSGEKMLTQGAKPSLSNRPRKTTENPVKWNCSVCTL